MRSRHLLDPAGSPGGQAYDGFRGGSFTFNLADGIDLDSYAIKGGHEFTLYEYIGGPDNVLTFTRENLSHIVFFGSAARLVPEPGTWAMMLMLWRNRISMRRRKTPTPRGPLAASMP